MYDCNLNHIILCNCRISENTIPIYLHKHVSTQMFLRVVLSCVDFVLTKNKCPKREHW